MQMPKRHGFALLAASAAALTTAITAGDSHRFENLRTLNAAAAAFAFAVLYALAAVVVEFEGGQGQVAFNRRFWFWRSRWSQQSQTAMAFLIASWGLLLLYLVMTLFGAGEFFLTIATWLVAATIVVASLIERMTNATSTWRSAVVHPWLVISALVLLALGVAAPMGELASARTQEAKGDICEIVRACTPNLTTEQVDLVIASLSERGMLTAAQLEAFRAEIARLHAGALPQTELRALIDGLRSDAHANDAAQAQLRALFAAIARLQRAEGGVNLSNDQLQAIVEAFHAREGRLSDDQMQTLLAAIGRVQGPQGDRQPQKTGLTADQVDRLIEAIRSIRIVQTNTNTSTGGAGGSATAPAGAGAAGGAARRRGGCSSCCSRQATVNNTYTADTINITNTEPAPSYRIIHIAPAGHRRTRAHAGQCTASH